MYTLLLKEIEMKRMILEMEMEMEMKGFDTFNGRERCQPDAD